MTAVSTLFYGLGWVRLGGNGWNVIGLTILIGAFALRACPSGCSENIAEKERGTASDGNGPLTLDRGRECILMFMWEAREQSHNTIQIGQAAQRVGLSVDTIRFYERRSLLPKVPRTVGRFRLYSEDDIARLTFIRQMQGLGFSLKEIRQLLDLRSMRPQDCGRMQEILGAKLGQVKSKIRELRKLERTLSLDMRKCERELQARKTRAAKMCPVLKDAGGKPKRLTCA